MMAATSTSITPTTRGARSLLAVRLAATLVAPSSCAPAAHGGPAVPHGSDTTADPAAQTAARLCEALPPAAARQLQAAVASSRRHASHVWRDTPPFNADGTLNGYVEIAVGGRRKWEFDIAAHQLRLDRTLDESTGGYPVNYGFVPQTVSCDGDPFDVLVLGAPIASGTLIAGDIVGVMYMDDEKGPDGKVIVAPKPDPSQERSTLTAELEVRLQRWFDAYKRADPGRWSAVRGFGSAEEGRRLVELTHRFYQEESDRQRTASSSASQSAP